MQGKISNASRSVQNKAWIKFGEFDLGQIFIFRRIHDIVSNLVVQFKNTLYVSCQAWLLALPDAANSQQIRGRFYELVEGPKLICQSFDTISFLRGKLHISTGIQIHTQLLL